ncbi:GrpE-domain-containing protein [Gyrodon lividus]|nr:GrpE-domain-containing protein [Gyrodon lividus]
MNAAYARRFLSSCTTSLSSRAIGRSSRYLLTRPSLALVTRQYSGDNAQSSTEKVSEDEQNVDSQRTEVTVEAEVLEKLKEKEAEVVDLTSRLRYLQADFLNLQRNAAREKEQQRDFAITRFAGDLLETVDVLALALKSIPQSALHPETSSEASEPVSDTSSPATPPKKSAQAYLRELHQGVEMTHRLLLSTLFKYHVKSFDPTGENFDPNRHEALYQVPVLGKEPGTVLECQKVGYMIKDRLLRAAQVGVVQETS